MAPHSSTLAWKITWMEEPGRLRSMESLTVGYDWGTSLSLFTFHFPTLEKEMATHSSVLAWKIPGTGEPVGLPSMGSHRVRHDWSDLAAAADKTRRVSMWNLRKLKQVRERKCWVGRSGCRGISVSNWLLRWSFSDMVICEQRLDRCNGYLEEALWARGRSL